MRRDLQPLRPGDEIAIELRILTARRADLIADRTRAINRLRAQLLEYFPALERAFDYSHCKAALILLTGYQTPDGLRRTGAAAGRLAAQPQGPQCRGRAPPRRSRPPNAQHTAVPGEKIAASDGRRAGQGGDGPRHQIADTDTLIEDRFREHQLAEIS